MCDREKLFEENQKLVGYTYKKVIAGKTDDFIKKHREELMQEGLIGLWKAAETFDETKKIKFSTYAIRVIRNQMLMHLRKQKKEPITVSIDEVLCDTEAGEILIGDTIKEPDKEDVAWILDNPNLTDRQRKIVRLVYLKYTQDEIGEIVGICRTMVSREMKNIKKMLENLL